jgi:uncharacterized protein YndB with AHSA1/START domain
MTQPFLYSVEREFSFPVSDLWSAWTDVKNLENWYHGTSHDSVKGATVSEFYVGGIWAVGIDVVSHNFAVYFYGTYQMIELHSRIEHSMHYTESKEEFAIKDMTTPSHDIVIDFEERGNSTWVKFSQFGELPEGQAQQAQAGMESYFDSLSNYLLTATN